MAYTSIPIKLKYKMDITTKNTSCGWNDMFEVYISYLDNKDYLASPNYTKFNIDSRAAATRCSCKSSTRT